MDAETKICNAWNDRSLRTNWQGLEDTLRQILKDSRGETSRTLDLIDEALAAFTRRGNERGE